MAIIWGDYQSRWRAASRCFGVQSDSDFVCWEMFQRTMLAQASIPDYQTKDQDAGDNPVDRRCL
ncbi:MAG: hypothetical protein JWQ69_5296 [Pseudomonas sp.]|nr:hypothetical protein [Pseudomonas sp.]